MKEKTKLSDHIMPHRMVGRLLWNIGESIVLAVLLIMSQVIWRTLYNAVPVLYIPVILLLAALSGAFYAAVDRYYLAHDQTMKKEFLDAMGEDYNEKTERSLLAHCDELWNDTALLWILGIIGMLLLTVRDVYTMLIDPNIPMEQLTATLWVRIPAYAGFVAAMGFFYAFFHCRFTVSVHNQWIASRLRREKGKLTAWKAFL